ncbi:hypothetical protein ACIBI9_10380 [Nonomuraea sp. NPDC050451]|uniref:hypothetical protein n=1 Tax=Nonomuraea sp. NPDC050451 TaxID=3364364 RepID=UPI0037B38420
MTAGRSTTHDIEIRDDIVIKRYRSWDRGEHRREWAALNVLAEHAPGLAPTPVRADLDGSPPTVVMSRLPGTPLRGLPTGPEQVRALATALTHLHHAIPGANAATARVHIIDWEDSGLADRAFELAEVAEHISHVDGDLDSDLLLAHLDLTPAEAARVHEFRRLLALGWLLMLGPGGPATRRNPPGALDRQAGRVLALLDS